MANRSDMKLQLVIEAVGKTETAFANLKRDLQAAQAQAASLGAAGNKSGDDLDRGTKKAKTGLQGLQSSAESLRGVLGSVFAVGTLAYFSKEVLTAGLAVERFHSAYKATFGGEALAERELAFASEQARRLGLELQSTTTAYGKFAASTRNTAIEGHQTREVFIGVAEAATALKLTTEETNGIFLALSQMMSKGKVSAEEMNGQLGERLPGALKIAADAMGMTTGELMNQMQQGKIMSADLLPKLAEELHKTYGTAASEAADQGQASINRFNNTLFETRAKVGEAAMPAFTSLLNILTPLITTFNKLIWGAEAFGISVEAMAHNVVTAIKYMTPGSGVGEASGPLDAIPGFKMLRNYKAYRATVNQDTAAADQLIQDRAAFWDGSNTPSTTQSGAEIEAEKKRNAARLAKEKAAAEAAERLKKAKQLAGEWRKIYADLAAEEQKAQPGMDAFDKREVDVNKKIDDLLLKSGADKGKLEEHRKQLLAGVAADRKEDEEKKRAEQETKRLAAAEKVRDALRAVDEQIAGNSLSELDRQLAAQDKFYLESLEKLQDAGLDFAAVVAKEPEIYRTAQARKLQILDEYNSKKRQAELAYQLSQVDYQEKGNTIPAAVAAGERVRLTGELLAGQEARLSRLAEQGPAAEQAWLQERDAISATRGTLLQYELALRDLSDDLAGGLASGFRSYVQQLGGGFKQMEGLAQQTAQGMEQAFSDFFFAAMQGKLKSFGDYVASFLSSVQRAIANIMAQQAAEGIISSIGSMFAAPASGGGAAMTSSTSVGNLSLGANGLSSPKYHSGGLVLHEGGKVMVPRFHFGGLASDEVPAVLLRKERVLSIEQNQLFERFANNARPSSNVQVNVINQTGQQVQAEQSAPRFDGEKMICDVVLKKMKSDPGFRNAMSSGGNY